MNRPKTSYFSMDRAGVRDKPDYLDTSHSFCAPEKWGERYLFLEALVGTFLVVVGVVGSIGAWMQFHDGNGKYPVVVKLATDDTDDVSDGTVPIGILFFLACAARGALILVAASTGMSEVCCHPKEPKPEHEIDYLTRAFYGLDGWRDWGTLLTLWAPVYCMFSIYGARDAFILVFAVVITSTACFMRIGIGYQMYSVERKTVTGDNSAEERQRNLRQSVFWIALAGLVAIGFVAGASFVYMGLNLDAVNSAKFTYNQRAFCLLVGIGIVVDYLLSVGPRVYFICYNPAMQTPFQLTSALAYLLDCAIWGVGGGLAYWSSFNSPIPV